MAGRVLIADATPTNRIVLRVRLLAACYDISQAASAADVMARVAKGGIDVIILASDLPDRPVTALCAALRRSGSAGEPRILVLQNRADPAARLALLGSGADDVMVKPVDDAVLLARMRNLMRARDSERELRLRDGTDRALGLAEAAAPFERPAEIAVLANAGETRLEALCAPLRARPLYRLSNRDPRDVLRDENPSSEVYVVSETVLGGQALSLLAELRARPASRHAGILYIARADQSQGAAAALDLGASDILMEPVDPREFALRLDKQIASERIRQRLRASVRAGLKAALTDPLTGLYNRRYALPHIERMAERAAREDRPFAVMIADLDRFKRINDRHGHQEGDRVLARAAERLSGSLRSADLIARLGGEEFLIAMPDTDAQRAMQAARRLCAAVRTSPDETVPVTISLGVAMGDGSSTVEGILEQSDAALYAAKKGGRNRAMLYDDRMVLSRIASPVRQAQLPLFAAGGT
ncbi:diguanylate cyclase [Litorisediminicola beolgyonensis]|uniref:diguanylate cyclase n=1 Tax=Litorisediminicola beolgyonensis TaxID=1173614 RepID=A0ABW3ZKZ7_9RHOB